MEVVLFDPQFSWSVKVNFDVIVIVVSIAVVFLVQSGGGHDANPGPCNVNFLGV